jgi:hypothetical protein
VSPLGALDQRRLLREAAALIEGRLCTQQRLIQVIQGPNILDAVAEWGLMPGAVCVYSRHGGSLLARSLPGQPTASDPAARSITACAFSYGPVPWGLCAEEQLRALLVATHRLSMSVNPRLIELPGRDAPPHTGAAVEATWAWPGVLRIVSRLTGQILAVSVPGRPTVLESTKDGR